MADRDDWVYIAKPGIDAIGGPVQRWTVDEYWGPVKGWKITDDYELIIDAEGQEKAVPKAKAAALKKEA